jgi:hypothetical protein
VLGAGEADRRPVKIDGRGSAAPSPGRKEGEPVGDAVYEPKVR